MKKARNSEESLAIKIGQDFLSKVKGPVESMYEGPGKCGGKTKKKKNNEGALKVLHLVKMSNSFHHFRWFELDDLNTKCS